jgi:[ribosomal protein S18]-alanine N-acetyltransferase
MMVFPDGFFLLEIFKNEKWVPIGYLCSEIWNEVPGDSIAPYSRDHDISNLHQLDGNTLYIASMTVFPENHGCGFGSILFKEAIKSICSQYKNIRTLLLIVNESWLAARRIYKDDGFLEIGNIPDYFVATETQGPCAIIMQRSVAK